MKTIPFQHQKNIVGPRVAQARAAQGLSQQQLAARLQVLGVGIDQQAVSRMERGLRIVTDYEVVCLSQALKVGELWLLGRE